MRLYIRAAAIAACIACNGCATIFTKSIGHSGLPYSGSSCDAYFTFAFASGKSKEKAGRLLTIFPLVDFPLSFVADTIYLPVDLFSKKQKQEKEPVFGNCHVPSSS